MVKNTHSPQQVHIDEDKVLLIHSPAVIKVSGTGLIFGAIIENKTIRLNDERINPVETPSKCIITIYRSKGFDIKKRTETGTSNWKNVIEKIETNNPKTTIILGSVDSGKSSISTYLANYFLQRKKRVSFIDADVGQGDIPPPTAIGAARLYKPVIDLRRVYPQRAGFIGNTSLYRLGKLLIKTIDTFIKFYQDSDIIIVNTDGYLSEEGIQQKREIIERVQPDLIIYLGNDERVINAFSLFKDSLICNSIKNQSIKSPATRLNRRLQQYKRFLKGGDIIDLPTDRLHFGVPGKLYYELAFYHDYVTLEPTGPLIPQNILKNLFIGLAYLPERKKHLTENYPAFAYNAAAVKGFGLLKSLSSDGKYISVYTRYKGNINTILLSYIALNDDFSSEYKISPLGY